jgi:hypothetical protein
MVNLGLLQAGTRADPRTRVPSVKIGLKVCLGIQNEAKMLPCILRCFPNVERLHIKVPRPPSFYPTMILHLHKLIYTIAAAAAVYAISV